MTKSKPLTDVDKDCLMYGWRRFVQDRGCTIRVAYLRTMATFYFDYVQGSERIDEMGHKKLLPPDCRPSFWQFRNIGRKVPIIVLRPEICGLESTNKTELK